MNGLKRYDRVKDKSTTTGTGTLTLLGTPDAGFLGFDDVVTTGDLVRYLILSGGDWEYGEGIFTLSGNTLSRLTVISSSNANALVNFTSGDLEVAIVAGSQDLKELTSNRNINILRNGRFINCSTYGYGTNAGMPDDWTATDNGHAVQGGFPTFTKQMLIDTLGIADGDIEGLWLLNESSGNAVDLSSNAYNLTDNNTVDQSASGLLVRSRDFEAGNSEYFNIATASAANLVMTTSQTWFCFIKPETLSGVQDVMAFRGTAGIARQMYTNTNGTLAFYADGLSPTTFSSDVLLQAGKWYFIAMVYNGTSVKLVVNGIEKSIACSGTMTALNNTPHFALGRLGNTSSEYYDGLMQMAGVLSVALSTSQLKRLFGATLYRGIKINTNGDYVYQTLPDHIVQAFRGKVLTFSADLVQDTTLGAQLEINDGASVTSELFSGTSTTPRRVSVSKLISATATSIQLRIKVAAASATIWADNVSANFGYGGVDYMPSGDDIARFPLLLAMRFPNVLSGYQYEQFKIHTNLFTTTMSASGSMTATSVSVGVKQFVLMGENAQNIFSVNFTNGGSASVANYIFLPFIVSSAAVSSNNAHPLSIVNNSAQRLGNGRYSSNNQLEVYTEAGTNWSLTANTIHDSGIYPINVS